MSAGCGRKDLIAHFLWRTAGKGTAGDFGLEGCGPVVQPEYLKD